MNIPLPNRIMPTGAVPHYIIGITALVSFVGPILGGLLGWPLWAMTVTAVLPWLPLFTSEMIWIARHYSWLALFALLVIGQTGHFFEHVAQMVQIHILGLKGAAARGIIGPLDIEWVHFIWNTWVLIAVLVLLHRFRTNPWLWPTALLASWHEIEHVFIMSVYLTTGRAGTPGLLSQGGAIGGGLPLARADLHFLYNLLETIPLLVAFFYQVRRSSDAWLAQAFPHLPQQTLIEATRHLRPLQFAAGETLVRQGEAADRFYILTQGQVSITRQRPDGSKVLVESLESGQSFGEIALLTHEPHDASVRATSDVEVLALDKARFHKLVDSSAPTAEELAQVMLQRWLVAM